MRRLVGEEKGHDMLILSLVAATTAEKCHETVEAVHVWTLGVCRGGADSPGTDASLAPRMGRCTCGE